MKKKPNYEIKNWMATNFIQMHLTTQNLERFVKDVTNYDAKKLWDTIEAHFAAKTTENTANTLDKFFDIQFLEGKMNKSINLFRHSFRHLCKVGTKFLEAVGVIYALRQLLLPLVSSEPFSSPSSRRM
jgi:hypothetical protein